MSGILWNAPAPAPPPPPPPPPPPDIGTLIMYAIFAWFIIKILQELPSNKRRKKRRKKRGKKIS